METLRHLADNLVDPVMFSLVLLVVGLTYLAVRRARRTAWALIVAGLLCLSLCSVPRVSAAFGRPLQRRALDLAQGTSFEGVRWVVVLGGGSSVQAHRPVTAWLTPASLERFVEGLRMAHLLDGSRLVFTGAGDDGRMSSSTAGVEASVAVALGFPADRIVEVPDAHDIRQELEAVARLVGSQRFVLVTSVEHLPRAVAEARARGLDPVPDPAGSVFGFSPGMEGWLPSSDALAHSRAALHEIVGGWWYRLTEP